MIFFGDSDLFIFWGGGLFFLLGGVIFLGYFFLWGGGDLKKTFLSLDKKKYLINIFYLG